MRVGLVAPPWLAVPPPGYGGTEAVVDQLARGLVGAAHEVMLFATGDSTCPVETWWTYTTAQTDRLGQTVVELRHVADAYEAVAGCDIVHDHTILGPIHAGTLATPPVITTVHGAFDADLEAVYRQIARHAAVIAISQSQRDSAPHVPIARVIRHGIDIADSRLGSGSGGYVLFLGRMSPDKGAHRAIDIARSAGIPIVVAAKCREPAEHAYFADEVAPRLGPGVDWVGEVGGARLARLLEDAAVALNPIRWPEPFGLVMIEAMAVGTPVLAFPEGAAPEIVENGVSGYLCRDEEEMAANIARATRLDRARCREHVARNFSTQRMVADHVAFYEQILAGHRTLEAVAS